MRESIIVIALCISVAITGYAVLRTGDADPSSRWLMTSVGIAFLVLLVGLGWISSSDASDGFLDTLFKFLPNIISWGSSTAIKTVFLTITLIAVAALSYWIGPRSLHKVNILTGSAKYVRLDGDTIPAPADGFLTKEVWKPGQKKETVQANIVCLTKEHRPWKPEIRGEMLECGEPLEPTLIVNGIDLSDASRKTTAGRRIHRGVQALADHLEADLPSRDVQDTLLVATWNIRLLGGSQARQYGARMEESLYYIAEIISHFDIVAIQEAQSDTRPLRALLDILGPDYDAIYSLVIPRSQSLNERLAFVYDRRKVRLGPVIASVVTDAIQFSRIPYVATFDVAGQRVTFCAVHMYFGRAGGEGRKRRIEEIKGLANFLKLTKQAEPEWSGPLILLGDMNAPDASSPEVQALKEAGFYLDPDLASLASDYRGRRTYDQIALLNNDERFLTARVGVFNFFEDVFGDAHEPEYRAELGSNYLMDRDGNPTSAEARKRHYERWKTYQMSDHLVKWAEYRLKP